MTHTEKLLAIAAVIENMRGRIPTPTELVDSAATRVIEHEG